MRAHLVEGDCSLPATDEPGKDLLRMGIQVGTEQRLGGEDTTDEHPADWQRRKARRLADGRLGEHLDGAVLLAIPAGDHQRGVQVLHVMCQIWQALAHESRAALLVGPSRRRWSKQTCIETQAGHHRRHRAHRSEQLQCRRGAPPIHDPVASDAPDDSSGGPTE